MSDDQTYQGYVIRWGLQPDGRTVIEKGAFDNINKPLPRLLWQGKFQAEGVIGKILDVVSDDTGLLVTARLLNKQETIQAPRLRNMCDFLAQELASSRNHYTMSIGYTKYPDTQKIGLEYVSLDSIPATPAKKKEDNT